jgi:hypothetical protein
MSAKPAMTALVYTDSDAADRLLRALALLLMERGYSLAGLVQHNQPRPGRSRCDMVLEDISGGALVPISQDRGPHARGCALDVGQLLQATQLVQASLPTQPQLVILNKFGKTESEGGGFRALIAEVVATGLPLVIAVPWRNIDSWRLFAGDIGEEIVLDDSPGQDHTLCEMLTTRLRHTVSHARFDLIDQGTAPVPVNGLAQR